MEGWNAGGFQELKTDYTADSQQENENFSPTTERKWILLTVRISLEDFPQSLQIRTQPSATPQF